MFIGMYLQLDVRLLEPHSFCFENGTISIFVTEINISKDLMHLACPGVVFSQLGKAKPIF